MLPLVVGSSVGSTLGASVARFLPKAVFTPIVLVALIVAAIYTWRRPELGRRPSGNTAVARHYLLTSGLGLGVGAYDGILARHRHLLRDLARRGAGLGFPREATAQAKIANLVTNLSAIAVFAAHGADPVAARSADGGRQSDRRLPRARTAISKGNTFVRRCSWSSSRC